MTPSSPSARPPSAQDRELDPAMAAIGEAIDALDGLGLADERGRVVVEPASEFHWD
ncbi:MAG: hypothetical protein IT306_21535 [Chloroflexi bacterium]|nr:hypothetical protein [Chloroflexota bacterium]